MRAELLEPFAPDGDRRYRNAVHDLASDRAVDAPVEQAPADAVLVVDGIFLQRPELGGCFDLVVFLDAPFETTYARMSRRDGSPADPDDPANRRYRQGQEIYLTTCRPRERADVLVDLTDVTHPRLVRPLSPRL
jgi:uridine kinase